jgi:hypothetical protein
MPSETAERAGKEAVMVAFKVIYYSSNIHLMNTATTRPLLLPTSLITTIVTTTKKNYWFMISLFSDMTRCNFVDRYQ